MHASPDGIQTRAGRDEQGTPVCAAEADVGRDFWYVDGLNLAAVSIKDMNLTTAGEIHVSLRIDGHTVGTECTEQSLTGQPAIILDLIRVRFLSSDIGHVES